ncbi:GNAT family N-acetyltransferase [Collimonas pratensis]|uniref:Acetyltransferase family protein n=1 Tax=Collimonas pratensis TaxID=279113 RepID=A0ABM5Z086_9BURK|nr:GNAT family N-acetyltransferase [Collimonas pratensis]AMP12494.1 acetyltransferase family protein [Collimonas pratensis]
MTTSPPDLDFIRSLEERALNAWPALKTALCGGWQLRLADGYTKRANSANPLQPRVAFAETLQVAEDFYGSHGLPAIFRITPLAPADAGPVLEQAGYHMIDPTQVMTVTLAARNWPANEVLIETTASQEWSEGFAQANGLSAMARPAHERILAAIAMPTAFATLTIAGRAVAYGLAVAENGMVGLFDIVVAPAARRSGAATTLVTALLNWGQVQGASSAYLQVHVSNQAAVALYGKLGFTAQYQYHYWTKP